MTYNTHSVIHIWNTNTKTKKMCERAEVSHVLYIVVTSEGMQNQSNLTVR